MMWLSIHWLQSLLLSRGVHVLDPPSEAIARLAVLCGHDFLAVFTRDCLLRLNVGEEVTVEVVVMSGSPITLIALKAKMSTRICIRVQLDMV